MLKLLQPGIEPLGQFDVDDEAMAFVVGGEVGVFASLDIVTDGYAADVFPGQGPLVQIELDLATTGELYGLIDEGTTGGGPDSSNSYGTLFGQVIGGVVGRGTGVGTLAGTGTVVVGPSTMFGSGKATLWTKPGLYGVTRDAWEVGAEFDAATVNTLVYGTAPAVPGVPDATAGKLSTGATGLRVATALGPVNDISLVSTTTVAAGDAAVVDFMAVYLIGV
jgi:hypothetical protein